MRFLSLCSGIEAASVAWGPLGWKAVAFSEIDAFPSAVLAHHYPNVPNWGDMNRFQEWPDADVDVLCGGTPCQSFSVAGLRKGLDDPRGNLMLVFGAVAAKYRPRWLVWENVPGVLSSNGGRDFGAFLGMLGQLGYGFAYRVLDAQYFGVAQRRRRVFVVGCLGDWRSAAAVLFERHSLSGHPAPSRETGKDTSGSTGDGLARCITTGEMKRQDWETTTMVAATLDARTKGGGFPGSDGAMGGHVVPVAAADITGALTVGHHGCAGHHHRQGDTSFLVPVAQPIPFDTTQVTSHANGGGQMAVAQPVTFRETADCLTAAYGTKWNGNASAHNGSLFVAQPVGIFQDSEFGVKRYDSAGTLRAGRIPEHQMVMQAAAVAFAQNTRDEVREMPYVGALAAQPGMKQTSYIRTAMQVRRLTPVECERLQGFPDDYTAIPWRGKPADQCPDGPRYKALGNSWAVPVAAWVGRRISEVEALHGRD